MRIFFESYNQIFIQHLYNKRKLQFKCICQIGFLYFQYIIKKIFLLKKIKIKKKHLITNSSQEIDLHKGLISNFYVYKNLLNYYYYIVLSRPQVFVDLHLI